MSPFIRLFILLIHFIFLSACQSIYSPSAEFNLNKPNLYLDGAYPTHNNIVIESSADIFALDEDMVELVETKLKPERDIKKRATKLLYHIFNRENVNLIYSTHANVTAREAYHSKEANCMSLTILAYVLATEADLAVNFQNIDVPEYWVRNGQYNMLTGHVNLLITKPKEVNKIIYFDSGLLEIDFDPFAVKKSFPKTIIDKKRILAMFYNNKGANYLANKQYDTAYAYLKAGTLADPSFSSIWGNMGILYRTTGNNKLAEQTYRHAISLDQNNLTALTNLSMLLGWQGQIEEMSKIDRDLLIKRINNPYYHALLADEASYRGEYMQAIKHYKKALRLDKKNHEIHYGLAKVYYKINDFIAAQKSIRKAIMLNKAEDTEQIYVAKLNFLKDAQYH